MGLVLWFCEMHSCLYSSAQKGLATGLGSSDVQITQATRDPLSANFGIPCDHTPQRPKVALTTRSPVYVLCVWCVCVCVCVYAVWLGASHTAHHSRHLPRVCVCVQMFLNGSSHCVFTSTSISLLNSPMTRCF